MKYTVLLIIAFIFSLASMTLAFLRSNYIVGIGLAVTNALMIYVLITKFRIYLMDKDSKESEDSDRIN